MILLPLITLSASALSAADTSDLANKTEQLHLNTIVNAEAIKRVPPNIQSMVRVTAKKVWCN